MGNSSAYNAESGGGRQVYHRLRRLLREGERDPGFQVLCWNCNAAKHHLGRCDCADGD